MEQWNEIRRRVLVEGVSRRQVQLETGLHWKTLQNPEAQRAGGPWPTHSMTKANMPRRRRNIERC